MPMEAVTPNMLWNGKSRRSGSSSKLRPSSAMKMSTFFLMSASLPIEKELLSGQLPMTEKVRWQKAKCLPSTITFIAMS
ncbi:hypothetical protein D3C72_2243400 [compost metagenome]